ncbi:WXG100 family type VII secretion target [Cellulomonas soli]
MAVSGVIAKGIVDGVSSSGVQLRDAATGLVGDVRAWGGQAAAVQETSDPRTYLVTPNLGTNEVQELRWSAGVVLGGLDWLAEQLLGFSILEEVVFKPFAGDFQDIKRASIAWSNTSQAFTAVAENFAGLTSSTMDGWKGEAGDAFRGAMVVASGAFVGVSQAALAVSGLAQNIAYVSQAACIGIGMLLKKMSEKLIRISIEAAVPVVGWAAAAVETTILIQDIISYVRLAYTIIEAIVDAIDSFLSGKTAVLQTLGVVEDLAEYAYRTARA